MIDIMIWLLKSSPKEVFAIGNNLSSSNTNFKFNDNVVSLINFNNGTTAKVSSNFGSVMPHDHQMRVFGTKGTLLLSNNKLEFFSSRNPSVKNVKITFPKTKNYKKNILDDFINIVYNKK